MLKVDPSERLTAYRGKSYLKVHGWLEVVVHVLNEHAIPSYYCGRDLGLGDGWNQWERDC